MDLGRGRAWAARFTGVRAPGRYRVGILGDASAASPWFTIGPAAHLYARPLANALYFFENERDGPDFIHTALRSAPGHLNDASAMTYRTPPVDSNGNFKGSLARYATGTAINATGGWFDAGDYLHFVETTSYTEAVLLPGVTSFPRQMGAGSGADFTGEVRFGLDFLRRMWHERSRTLYYEVGTGEANSYYLADHDIWRLPQADDHYRGTNPRYRYVRHPPVFRAGAGAEISPNLAGRLAADFALCYQVLRHSDPGYAGGCLRSPMTDVHPGQPPLGGRARPPARRGAGQPDRPDRPQPRAAARLGGRLHPAAALAGVQPGRLGHLLRRRADGPAHGPRRAPRRPRRAREPRCAGPRRNRGGSYPLSATR